MYCSKCGKEIPDNSTFCPFCGAPTANAQQAQNQNTATLQDMQKKVREALNTAGEKAGQIYQENAPKVREALNNAGEKAGQLYQENAPKVKEALNNAGEKAGQLYQENAPKVKEALNNAGTTINEKAQGVSTKIASIEPKKAKKTAVIAAAAVVCLAIVGLLGKMLFKKPELTVERFDELAEKLADQLDLDYDECYEVAEDDLRDEYVEGLKASTGFIANKYDDSEPSFGVYYMEFETTSAAKTTLSNMVPSNAQEYLKEHKELKNGDKYVYEGDWGQIIAIRDGKKFLFCVKEADAPKEFDKFIKDLGY